MPIVKQNSWVAGEINPNLTEDINNPLYLASALELFNVYITKTQTIKRFPSTESIEIPPAPLFDNTYALKYQGVNYFIGSYSSSNDYVYDLYKYDETNGGFVFLFSLSIIGLNESPLDFVAFENKIILTFGNRRPLLLEIVNDQLTSQDFFFKNVPCLDINTIDYSQWTFGLSQPSTETIGIIEVRGSGCGDLITNAWLEGMYYAKGQDTFDFIGQGKITELTRINADAINLTVDIISPLAQHPTLKGIGVILQQPVFTDVLGWPKVVSFFDGRLYFANTKTLPMLIAASRVNLINNFDVGKQLPAEAIAEIINDTSSSEIKHISGHIGLFIFTDSNEHVVIPSIDKGITPETFISQRLSDWGSNNIKPVIYSNSLLFCDKTNRKILKIDSSSANAFSVNEITKGMEISKNIDYFGVVDDKSVDVKLLSFGYKSDNVLSMVNLGVDAFGKTSYQVFPDEYVDIEKINFWKINNRSILSTITTSGANVVLSFTDKIVGQLNNVRDSQIGSTITFNFDNYLYSTINKDYIFIPSGTTITIPTDYDLVGFATNVNIRSIPLVYGNLSSWDTKRISYIFISYFRSARFKVNGKNIAFPTIEEIEQSATTLKTNYDKIPISANSNGKYNYIEVKSNEPHPIEIQAYGWSIRGTIMT